jgi:hypothetical protein
MARGHGGESFPRKHDQSLTMLFAPAKMCTSCSRPALPGSRWCAAHQTSNQELDNSRTADKWRRENDELRPLYSQTRWCNGTRPAVLFRDPLCTAPGCGNRASTVADHYPLSAHEVVEQFGLDEFWNTDRCRGVCKPCHDAHTREETERIRRSKRSQLSA